VRQSYAFTVYAKFTVLLCALGWKGGDQSRPKSILFVEELTGLISENLPDLWKLGQTYLNKTLFQVGGVIEPLVCALCFSTDGYMSLL